ncbi:MAG: hypothetical protein K2K94_08050 [Muribaculaceae bacterium]|nr:hypothetical protein [Muribaculaceae bacterium]
MENRFSTADTYIDKNSNFCNLYADTWQENTTALLLSPREADKTSFATDIADSLTSQGQKVFYITTQRLSKSNLAKITGNTNLYVHSPEFVDAKDNTDFADIVIADIEEAIESTGARIFIVDSLSRIAALSFGKNASANYVMKRLVALQVRHKISLLILAHDATRAANRSLINLADCQIEIPNTEPIEEKQPATPTQHHLQETRIDDPQAFNLAQRQKLIDYIDEEYMIIDDHGKMVKFKDWKGREDYLHSKIFFDLLAKTSNRQTVY